MPQASDIANIVYTSGTTGPSKGVPMPQPTPNAAGWAHTEHFEVVIVDPETDIEVPRVQVGEILVRPRVPFGFMAGYLNVPEKTVEAWRNLRFHTGDAGTMRQDGMVTFIDRIKDCIRRHGENISATEVEAVVAMLPGVAEVAAYAVPSDAPGSEDEVMLSVVPRRAPRSTARRSCATRTSSCRASSGRATCGSSASCRRR